MNVNLKLQSKELNEDVLQTLTQEICQSINQATIFEASISENRSQAEMKGDAVSIGEIVLTILGSGGAVVALLGVFKSFVERNKELSVKMKNQNGEELEITSKNIDSLELKLMFDKFFVKKIKK